MRRVPNRLIHQTHRRLQPALPSSRRCIVLQPDDWRPPGETYSVPPAGYHDWNYDEKDWQKDPFRRLTRLGIEVITEVMMKLGETPLSQLISAGGDTEQFVTGHPQQFALGARDNLRIGYNRYTVPDSRPVWAPTEELVEQFSGGLGVSSVDQVAGRQDSVTLPTWEEARPEEVADEWSGGIPFLRSLLQNDGKLTRCLTDPVSNKRLVLIKGNHNALLMSRTVQRLIEEWTPDTVVIETDSEGAHDAAGAFDKDGPGLARRVRVAKYLAAGMAGLSAVCPPAAPLALGWTWFFCQMLAPTDVLCALRGAEASGARVVLADWHRAERAPMQNLAKGLDEAGRAYSVLEMGRNYNRSRLGWKIDLGALSQLFVGASLAPAIPREAFLEFFEHRKANEPHDYFMYEKRNDLIASAILNSHTCGAETSAATRAHFASPGVEKVVAVVGAAHVDGVVDRLTCGEDLGPPFDIGPGGHLRVRL
eukprot:m.117101 g.117101  ORF g.117101 m.117101 type:complete len:478 (+) comp13175_c0_seq2:267-1700(+)